ncbi:unnamed protein product, partial [Staurois parvus]
WGDDYQESNGRVAEQKQLQLKAIHRPRLKSPPSSSVGRRLSPVQWLSGDPGEVSVVIADAMQKFYDE